MTADPFPRQETLCPKRIWVLTVFSDDEALDEAGTLPQGLRFHLGRCPSCAALAGRLRAVVDGLREVADTAPGQALADKADLQLLQAIKHGAKLTGRVAIPEDEIPFGVQPRPTWQRLRRLAAAAAIALMITTIGVMQWRNAAADRIADERNEGRWRVTDPASRLFRPSLQPTRPIVAEGGSDPSAICVHLTHEEAAACDKPHAPHVAAIIRPRSGPGAWGSTEPTSEPVSASASRAAAP